MKLVCYVFKLFFKKLAVDFVNVLLGKINIGGYVGLNFEYLVFKLFGFFLKCAMGKICRRHFALLRRGVYDVANGLGFG